MRLAVRLLLVAASWLVWPVVWFWYSIALFAYLGNPMGSQCDECGPPTSYWQNVLILVWFGSLIALPVLVTLQWWRWRRALPRAGAPADIGELLRHRFPRIASFAPRKSVFWTLAGVVIIVTGLLGWYLDPPGEKPRDPISLARRFSGLDVPADATVVEFYDHEMGPFHSELDTHVSLALSPSATVRLTREARGQGYRPITASLSEEEKNPPGISGDLSNYTGASEARAELGEDRAGLYRYHQEGTFAYNVAVLDSARARLLIRLRVQ